MGKINPETLEYEAGICPLRLGTAHPSCIKDNCAWWYDHENTCHIVRGMDYIRGINAQLYELWQVMYDVRDAIIDLNPNQDQEEG